MVVQFFHPVVDVCGEDLSVSAAAGDNGTDGCFVFVDLIVTIELDNTFWGRSEEGKGMVEVI